MYVAKIKIHLKPGVSDPEGNNIVKALHLLGFASVRNVTTDYPPTLLIHGTEDTDVPYELSADVAKELTRHKVSHELVTVRGRPNPGLLSYCQQGTPFEVAEAHAAS